MIHQIREYILCCSRPFTTKQIANEMGLKYELIGDLIRKLELDGFIKLIGYGKWNLKVYAYNRNYVYVEKYRGRPSGRRLKKNKQNENNEDNQVKQTRGKYRKTRVPKNTMEYLEKQYRKQLKKKVSNQKRINQLN